MISDGVAYTVTRILEENIQYGTGVGANYGAPAAGKTGTTEEWSDAWFCGYTPRLGTTVWVGYPRAKIPMTSVHGIRVTGGSFPAQIWRLFMSSAIGKLEPESFPEPKDEPEWKTSSGASTRDPSAPTTAAAARAAAAPRPRPTDDRDDGDGAVDTVPDAPPASGPPPKPKPPVTTAPTPTQPPPPPTTPPPTEPPPTPTEPVPG